MSKRTAFDFGGGRGPVPAHRHQNPDGSRGGWVADTATVDSTAHIGPLAQIFGKARVYGKARVWGKARVFELAQVDTNAKVRGLAQISGKARISDNAHIYGVAWVSGRAQVSGKAEVFGNASVDDHAHVFGSARVSGEARISGSDSQVAGSVRVGGSTLIYDGARVEKPEDLRTGDGWTAYRTVRRAAYKTTPELMLLAHTPRTPWREKPLSSWDELSKALLELGLLSAMEYLAQALESDRAS